MSTCPLPCSYHFGFSTLLLFDVVDPLNLLDTKGHALVMGLSRSDPWMDLMNLKVFSNLDDSMMYGATGQEERG